MRGAERLVHEAPKPIALQALTSGFSRMSGEQAQRAYATSALAARRLIEVDGGTAVAMLLRDLGDDVVRLLLLPSQERVQKAGRSGIMP